MAEATSDTDTIDLYEVLGLERDDTAEDLLNEVRFLKAHWAPRADRSGASGEAARANMVAISAAERAFATETSRNAYDRRLARREPSADFTDPDPTMATPQIDFYDVLSLEQSATTEQIRTTLASARLNWQRRANREGKVGEQAMAMLESIDAADKVFSSDETRARYDKGMATTHAFEETPSRTDVPSTIQAAALTPVTLKPAPVASVIPARIASIDEAGLHNSDGTVVNLYDELSLNRDDATLAILSQLRDELRPSWQARATRAGRPGEQARAKLEFIAHAEEVFANESSREQYDLQLRKRPEAKREDAQIDWLGIAWNYYFINDMGAAAVASRKSREQSPDDALPYVVTAWVELAQDEAKRAKQNADEAFVLDELGEDTADVHHVRGAVYHAMAQYDRAIDSFDRALAKATPGEASEILLRKAWTFESKHDIQGMIGSCIRALSNGAALPSRLRIQLEETTLRAIARKCYVANNTIESLHNYEETQNGLKSSSVAEPSRTKILTFINEQTVLLTSIRRLEEKANMLKAVGRPEGGKPDIPIKSIAGGAVCVLLIGLHITFLFIALALLGFATYVATRRSDWTSRTEAWDKAQAQLQLVEQELAGLRTQAGRALTRG